MGRGSPGARLRDVSAKICGKKKSVNKGLGPKGAREDKNNKVKVSKL